jgi:hypothetical protein
MDVIDCNVSSFDIPEFGQALAYRSNLKARLARTHRDNRLSASPGCCARAANCHAAAAVPPGSVMNSLRLMLPACDTSGMTID